MQDDIRERAYCPEPQCGAPRRTACDRSGDPYPLRKRAALAAEGASHYSRMLVAYGKSPEVALQLGGLASGVPPQRGTMDDLAVDLAPAPATVCPRARRAPGGGACPARRGTAATTAARGRAPQRQIAQIPEEDYYGTGPVCRCPGFCFDCEFAGP